jgi:hypothetical protein
VLPPALLFWLTVFTKFDTFMKERTTLYLIDKLLEFAFNCGDLWDLALKSFERQFKVWGSEQCLHL